MELTERQYERIARYLDGETVKLDADELAAAQRINRQEQRLGDILDVRVSPAALAAVERRLAAGLTRHRSGVLRFAYYAAAAVAAAAVVLAVANLPFRVDSGVAEEIPTSVLFGDDELPEAEVELAALAEQVDQLEQQLVVSVPPQPHEAFGLEPYPAPDVGEPMWNGDSQTDLSG